MDLFLWLAALTLAFGQAAVETEAELKQVLVPYYASEASVYDFFLDVEQQRPLVLEKKPVLTWTNVDHYMGAVFVWTYEGRPEVIGCIGSQQLASGISNVFHEFHSLSEKPLPPVSLGGTSEQWKPVGAGVTFQDVVEAPAPNDSERLRLAQMRGIAREFSGAMKDGQDVTELRLLPQPLYRYKSLDRGVIDGAIFALVWKGTDPEVLLILEDRKTESGNRWQVALARFNFREMWVTRNEKEIWRVGVNRTTDNYITGNVGSVDRGSLPRVEAPATTEKP
jgi:hypothetical protein